MYLEIHKRGCPHKVTGPKLLLEFSYYCLQFSTLTIGHHRPFLFLFRHAAIHQILLLKRVKLGKALIGLRGFG